MVLPEKSAVGAGWLEEEGLSVEVSEDGYDAK